MMVDLKVMAYFKISLSTRNWDRAKKKLLDSNVSQLSLNDIVVRFFGLICPVLNMVYTFPPNKWRTRWDKV
ncbi:hypothetical protein C0073_016355 [Aeromonas veronii]|nr:hypothetical protein C0073_016355 [Aeromonas veronii]